MNEQSIIPAERVQQSILFMRKEKVMLDSDLAELYGVETRTLVQAVKRNIDRFPEDFMFQLTSEAYAFLRSQTVTLKRGRGQHRKYIPYAFTEQGIAMLSSVLRSTREVQVNVEMMRTFVQLRKESTVNKSLSRRLSKLEQKYDKQFVVFDALRNLIEPPVTDKQPIGFVHQPRKKDKKHEDKKMVNQSILTPIDFGKACALKWC